MILRCYVCLLFIFASSVNASLFDQLQLPKSLEKSQKLQFSQPYQCIQAIDEFLQAQKKNVITETARLSSIRDNAVTYSDIVLVNQQKALCYYYAGHIAQASILLEKTLQNDDSNIPMHLLRQGLLIKSHILAQSPTLADVQVAKYHLGKVVEQIDNHSYQPTDNGNFALYYIKGEIALRLLDYDSAMTAFRQAEQFAQKTPLNNNSAWVSYAIGQTYEKQEKLSLALNAYNKAESLLLDDVDILNGLLSKQMSQTYISQENYKLAISYANQSAQFYQNLGNKLQLSTSLLELANMHRKIKEYNLSLVYYFNALDLLKISNEKDQANIVYFEVGKTYLQMGNYKLAEKYLANAEQLFSQNKQNQELLESLVHLASLSLQQQQHGNALVRLNRALILAQKVNNNQLLETVYLYFAIAYEETRQYQKALESYKQYVRFNKLTSFQSKKQITVNNSAEGQEIRTQKIDQLELKLAQALKAKQNLILNTIFLLLALLVILYLYFSNKKTLQTKEHMIEQQSDAQDIHPITGLKNYHCLKKYMPTPLQEARYFSDWEYSDKQNYVYCCAIINLDFLQSIRELYSLSMLNQVQAALGSYLVQQLKGSEFLFQLNDNQLLLIKKTNKNYDPELVSHMILDWFQKFQNPISSDNNISIGMVCHPFLYKYPTSISPEKLLDIGTLALSSAIKLNQMQYKNSWVQLSALTYTQPAFFHGDIWHRSKQAIEKGLIKVISSADKNDINW